jgi:hypothetical protein
MTERERWIVYPLLFLALGAALRDKLSERTTTKSIICEELLVVEDGASGREPTRLLARIGASEAPPGKSPSAQLIVNGQVFVDGQILTKAIVADNYAYRGVPFTPALKAILPGISPTDLLHALQRAAEAAGSPHEQSTEGDPSAPAASEPPEVAEPPAEQSSTDER